MIAVIDYGAGNISSVVKALKYLNCDVVVTRDSNILLNADGAILPGVGSFGNAINSMIKSGVKDSVIEYTNTGKPFLGICLGLQLLFPESEESGKTNGLNILKGSITKIPNINGLKIPHMGWNSLNIQKSNGLFKGITGTPYVYFVHSYYLNAQDKNIVSATTEYGVTIDASVEKKNIFATQFHPEKSGDVGLKMLKNFADMTL